MATFQESTTMQLQAESRELNAFTDAVSHEESIADAAGNCKEEGFQAANACAALEESALLKTSQAPLANGEVRCLAQAVVAALLSSASLKLAAAQDDGSSDESDDLVFHGPCADSISDDEPDFLRSMVDSDRTKTKVLDKFQGKFVKVSNAAHRNMEKVAEVVHQNMQVVVVKSKKVSQAARVKSERLQEALPSLADTPRAVSQAATAQSERMQKNVELVKSKTNGLASNTIEYAKEKTEIVKGATHALSVTMSDRAHTGLDFAKEKAEIARDTARAVSATVSEKAHNSFDLVKEKAETARGTAQAVSTSVSQKAHKGFDLAKETARSMRDGNCMDAVHVHVPTHVIRRRGGA